MENKERENANTNPRRANAGKCVERLEMKFGGKKYDTQLKITRENRFFYA